MNGTRLLCLLLAGVFLLFFAAFPLTTPAESRFIDNGDGTISDHQSGLMWTRKDNAADIYVTDAEQYVRLTLPATLAGQHDDWRLPSLEELETLVVDNHAFRGVKTECGAVARIQPLFEVSCVMVWSSDRSMGTPLIYDFSLGESFTIPRHAFEGCRVLAVRKFR